MADGRIQGSGDQERDLGVSNFTDHSGGSEANQGEVRLSTEPPRAQASKAHWSDEEESAQERLQEPRTGGAAGAKGGHTSRGQESRAPTWVPRLTGEGQAF